MARLTIALANVSCDLPGLLDALGPKAHRSEWTIERLHYVSRNECDIPVFHGESGARVQGAALVSGLTDLLQVIDGDFRAFNADATAWIVLRAVDSTYWEVISEDQAAIAAIRERFGGTDAPS